MREALAIRPVLLERRTSGIVVIPVHDGPVEDGCRGQSGIELTFCPWSGIRAYFEGSVLRKLEISRFQGGVGLTTASFYLTRNDTPGIYKMTSTTFATAPGSSAITTVTEVLLTRVVYDGLGAPSAIYADRDNVPVDSPRAAALDRKLRTSLHAYRALLEEPREEFEHEPFVDDGTLLSRDDA